MAEVEAASAPAADSDPALASGEGAVRLADVGKKHRQGSSSDSCSAAFPCSGERSQQQQLQQQQQQQVSPPPEAAMPAPPAPRGCCHRRAHAHQSHRRCCCVSHCSGCHRGKASSNCSGSGSSYSGSLNLRRRCGCRLGGFIFLLIPRKALSPGAAFLFSLLQESSPRFRCAVDMGGTLAKLVFIEELEPQSAAATAAAAAAGAAGSAGFARPDPQLAARVYAGNCDAALDLASPLLTIRASPRRVLRFTYFRTKAFDSLIECLRSRDLLTGGVLRMTGGGAMKYAGLFKDQLGVSLQRTDEMDSIMAGLVLLASHTNSVFRFDLATRQRIPVDVSRDLYPFLVVNIGSGVSILKAKSARSFVRVTGTCIGGGTVLGLARLLFHAKSFRQVVRLSERGTDALDLRVADLCGDAAGSRCIAPGALASSFGRLYLEDSAERARPRKEDIARSLIHMVSYNLGYLAYLVGTAHGVRRIFFAGKFINNYDLTMESITQGVNFYMQQYDHHTPESFRRGPASPLLAAPPDFNVNAQQQALLQQQLLLQQQQQKASPLVTAAPSSLMGESSDQGTLREQQEGVLGPETTPNATLEAVPLPSDAAEAASPSWSLSASATDGDMSPVCMPSGPQLRSLTQELQKQQQKQQQHHPPPAPGGHPLSNSGNLLCPPLAQSGNNGAPPNACWAPFEVLFLRHDGYLGALGALVAPGHEAPPPN
ncbi:hypothetical protein Esti_002847 [Eimeria stiedai]